MNASSPRALIIDADTSVRQLLRKHFELTGFSVDEAVDGHAGLDRLRSTSYRVVILDLVLPRIDGAALCRTARADGPNIEAAILMVSARSSESDKVVGLASGADDYLTKPFGVRELLARTDAIMRRIRRAEAATAPDSRRTSALALDTGRREAFVRGQRVELTRQEFDVLNQLAARPGTVFTRAALLQLVWSEDGRRSERTVDVAISRLRRKIECNPHHPQLIITAWGVGYKLADSGGI
jgi:DNA-binding response OmpR family regulator